MSSLINLATEESYPLTVLMTVGRAKDCAIPLPDSHVSRQHALIRQLGEREYWFTDLGSINGSYVNGQRVVTSLRLSHDDLIRIADFEFRVDLGAQEALTTRHHDPATDITIMDNRHFDATMLVSDIRGYTRISEKLAPAKLAQLVGGWYKSCYQVLHDQGATIDKFIGDSVLASWTGTTENEAMRAVTAALGLQKACIELHQAHAEMLAPHDWTFSSGVGIHMGQVSFGSAGLGGRTIIGDAVNVTFHLEALTRQLPHSILISTEVLDHCQALANEVEFCGEFPMKSRTEMLGVYTLKSQTKTP